MQLCAVYVFEYVARGCAAKVRPQSEYHVGCPELYAALQLCYQVSFQQVDLSISFFIVFHRLIHLNQKKIKSISPRNTSDSICYGCSDRLTLIQLFLNCSIALSWTTFGPLFIFLFFFIFYLLLLMCIVFWFFVCFFFVSFLMSFSFIH